MANISDLVKDVQATIPEIPSFIAIREYTRAAREFFEKTRAWREDIQLSTTASVATIDVSSLITSDTELVDVVSIKNSDGGEPVVPRTIAWLDKNLTDWRGEEATDAQWFTRESNNTIRLVYTPDATTANKYFARVAIKPTTAATVIDDLMANKYDEVLVQGTLSRLLALPRKPWTDPALAGYYRGLFELGIPAARTVAAEEHQTGQPRKVKYGGL